MNRSSCGARPTPAVSDQPRSAQCQRNAGGTDNWRKVAELTAFGERIAASGYTDVLVCGMGGSSLAPEVL